MSGYAPECQEERNGRREHYQDKKAHFGEDLSRREHLSRHMSSLLTEECGSKGLRQCEESIQVGMVGAGRKVHKRCWWEHRDFRDANDLKRKSGRECRVPR